MHNRTNKKQHDLLKIRAGLFLQAMGCTDIVEEYPIKPHRQIDTWWQRGLYIDIYAPTERIAVECGGINEIKLKHLVALGIKLYILPYSGEPYLWEQGLRVCASCGNLLLSPVTNDGQLTSVNANKPFRHYIEENIKEYLKTFPNASLNELSEQFEVHPSIIENIIRIALPGKKLYDLKKQEHTKIDNNAKDLPKRILKSRILKPTSYRTTKVLEIKTSNPSITLNGIAQQVGVSSARVWQILQRARVSTKRPAKPQLQSVCKHCGITFEGQGKFCSEKCHYDYQNIQVTCSSCGKIFTLERGEYNARLRKNKTKQIYCSKQCLGEKHGHIYGFGKSKQRLLKPLKEWCKLYDIDITTIAANIANYTEDIEIDERDFNKLRHWVALHNNNY